MQVFEQFSGSEQVQQKAVAVNFGTVGYIPGDHVNARGGTSTLERGMRCTQDINFTTQGRRVHSNEYNLRDGISARFILGIFDCPPGVTLSSSYQRDKCAFVLKWLRTMI